MSSKIRDFTKGKDVKVHECGGGKDKKPKRNYAAIFGVLGIAAATLGPMAFEQYNEYKASQSDDGVTKEMVLAEAFTGHSISNRGDTLLTYNFMADSAAMPQVKELVDMVMQTKTGQDVLHSMADNKCVLAIMPIDGSTMGFYDHDLNVVCLNPIFSKADMASTLVHEAKHAQQAHRSGYGWDFKYEKESFYNLGRAMEGDAVMTEAHFCFELMTGEKPNADCWIAFRSQSPEVADAFINAMIKHKKDPVKVSQETMLAWFKDKDYVKGYELQYAGAMENALENAVSKKEVRSMFSESIPIDSIASRICVINGQKYFGTDGSALKDASVYYIHRETRDKLEAVDAKQKEMTMGSILYGRTRTDKSYESFYVIESNGSMTSPANTKGTSKKQLEGSPKKGSTIHFYDAVRMMQGGNSGK